MSWIPSDPMTLAEIALILLAVLAAAWTTVLKRRKAKLRATQPEPIATQPTGHKDGTLYQLTRIANALDVITGAAADTGNVAQRAEALATQLDALPNSPIPPSVLAGWIRESVLQQKKAA